MANNMTNNEAKLFLPAVNPERECSSIKYLNKDVLLDLFLPLAKLLTHYTIVPKIGSKTELVRLLKNNDNIKSLNKLLKGQLSEIYLSFTKSLDNLQPFINGDSRLKKVWELIITSKEVDSKEIEKILGREVKIGVTSSWHYHYFPEALFYPLTVTYVTTPSYYAINKGEKKSYGFTVRPADRANLAKIVFGEKIINPEVLTTLPLDDNLVTEDFERFISSDLAYLSGVAMTGNVLSATGNITAAKLKSMKKNFKTPEFGINEGDYPVDRIEMLVNAYFLFKENGFAYKEVPDTTNPGKFAKYVATKMGGRLIATKLGILLPAFKGFTKVWTENANGQWVTDAVASLIGPAADGWMSLENLSLRFLCTDLSNSDKYRYLKSSTCTLFGADAKSKNTLKRKSDILDIIDVRSKNIDWFEEVDFPFVLHWLKMLCATGLLEIAEVKSPELRSNDPLEGMRYVRLTSLGLFAFGFTDTYTLVKRESAQEIEIDDSNGIITVLSDSCPYIMFLQQISESISSNRFKITPASLIKNCTTNEQVLDRLDNLELFVDIDQYPGMSAIIDEAEKRIKCAERLQDQYVIVKLKPGLPDLVSLITTYAPLRSKVILAEQGICLVKYQDYYKFKEICSKHGYLLD